MQHCSQTSKRKCGRTHCWNVRPQAPVVLTTMLQLPSSISSATRIAHSFCINYDYLRLDPTSLTNPIYKFVSLPDTPATFTGLTTPMGTPPASLVKRGPGRPRSKTATPISRGTRGTPRTRRPIGPLLVPLGRSPNATPPGSSPATSRAPSPSTHTDRGLGILE